MRDLSAEQRETFLSGVSAIPANATRDWGPFYYSLVMTQKPGAVVETGVMAGYTTAWIALACAQVGAQFDAIDLYGAGEYGYTQAAVEQNLVNCGLDTSKFYLTEGDASIILRYVRGPVGIAFLDDDHSYHGVTERLSILWPRLERGGLILSHDADMEEDSPDGRVGVRAAFQAWHAANPDSGLIVLPGDLGVAILQKSKG
jgi:predicted O-methyltransferase YrrM